MRLQWGTARASQRFLHNDVGFTTAVVLSLVGIEWLGRRHARSDFDDGVGVLALIFIVSALGLRHRRRQLGWYGRLVAIARRLIAACGLSWVECGVDFRSHPPLHRAIPRGQAIALGAVLAAFSVAAAASPWLPRGLRVLADVSYVGYLVLLASFWSTLLAGSFALGLFPIALIHDYFATGWRLTMPTRRTTQVAATGLYILALTLAGVFLPLWCALAVAASGWAVGMIALFWPPALALDVIWWAPRRTSDTRVVSWLWFAGALTTTIVAAPAALVLLGGGEVVLGTGAGSPFIITPSLATFFAWTAAGASVTWSILLLAATLPGRTSNPLRPAPTMVAFTDDVDPAAERAFRAACGARGLGVRATGSPPSPTDVLLTLVPARDRERLVRSWPLEVEVDDLTDDETWRLVVRRDEIQRRRLLFRGLSRVFRAAAGSERPGGEGYWLAPHLWCFLGLTRDSESDPAAESTGPGWDASREDRPRWLEDVIGPPWHRVLSQPVRRHAYEVLAALDVSLIFVEDGVGYRRLRRVLRLLFDFHDMSGGREPLREIHLGGVPGVRVLIHEFDQQRPFTSEIYPTPEYEELGRARILHIFRDRGEDEVRVTDPVNPERHDVPVLIA